VNSVRNAAGTAVRFAKPRGIRELVFRCRLPSSCPSQPAPRRHRRRFLLGRLRPDTYRSDRKDQSIQFFTLAAPPRRKKPAPKAPIAEAEKKAPEAAPVSADTKHLKPCQPVRTKQRSKTHLQMRRKRRLKPRLPRQDKKAAEALPTEAEKAALEAALAEGVILGESQNFTRSLVNEPGTSSPLPFSAGSPCRCLEEVGLTRQIFHRQNSDLKGCAFWSVAPGLRETAADLLRYEPRE